jgi:hypothetical protein
MRSNRYAHNSSFGVIDSFRVQLGQHETVFVFNTFRSLIGQLEMISPYKAKRIYLTSQRRSKPIKQELLTRINILNHKIGHILNRTVPV